MLVLQVVLQYGRIRLRVLVLQVVLQYGRIRLRLQRPSTKERAVIVTAAIAATQSASTASVVTTANGIREWVRYGTCVVCKYECTGSA